MFYILKKKEKYIKVQTPKGSGLAYSKKYASDCILTFPEFSRNDIYNRIIKMKMDGIEVWGSNDSGPKPKKDSFHIIHESFLEWWRWVMKENSGKEPEIIFDETEELGPINLEEDEDDSPINEFAVDYDEDVFHKVGNRINSSEYEKANQILGSILKNDQGIDLLPKSSKPIFCPQVGHVSVDKKQTRHRGKIEENSSESVTSDRFGDMQNNPLSDRKMVEREQPKVSLAAAPPRPRVYRNNDYTIQDAVDAANFSDNKEGMADSIEDLADQPINDRVGGTSYINAEEVLDALYDVTTRTNLQKTSVLYRSKRISRALTDAFHYLALIGDLDNESYIKMCKLIQSLLRERNNLKTEYSLLESLDQRMMGKDVDDVVAQIRGKYYRPRELVDLFETGKVPDFEQWKQTL